MDKSYKAWATWSIAIFIVWGLIFLVRSRVKSFPSQRDLLLIFSGYCIAWLAATIKFLLIIKGLK